MSAGMGDSVRTLSYIERKRTAHYYRGGNARYCASSHHRKETYTMKTSLKVASASAALFASVAMTGCGSNSSNTNASASSSAVSGSVSGKVEVYAAASLRNAGTELMEAFEKENPGVEITYSFEGSSKLVQKIEQGASPDLLITADTQNMDKAAKLDEFKDAKREVIATNKLVLVTAEGNPGKINSLDDLKNTEGVVAVCKVNVPCGTLADEELKKHHIELKNATTEGNVSEVTTKVTTGNADAGFIYTTDLAAAKKDGKNLGSVDLPDVPRNEYPAALTTKGSSSDAAKKFNEWLSSDEAQKILAKYDFESPQTN